MVRSLCPGPTWIPTTVAEWRTPLSYMYMYMYLGNVENGEQWRWHIDHLKPRNDSIFHQNKEPFNQDRVNRFESFVEDVEVSSTMDTRSN